MDKYLLALDQGTTSSRAIVFDRSLQIKGSAQLSFTQYYPQSGWVEHDPMEILSSQTEAMHQAIRESGISPSQIAAIGIANQRETTMLWDRETGLPVSNAIVWQCRRTAPIVDSLREKGLESYVKKATGLVLDAYFSATKIKWMLDNIPGARAQAEKGQLLFGTVDTWLAWNLTRGKCHATDYTNASRTMIYNIHTLGWDEGLLAALGIPASMLPQVKNSSEFYGYASIDGTDIPITGMMGDQQAALFGQTCFDVGELKNTYGTGCFLLMNTGSIPCESNNGLITTIASGINGQIAYALEGSVFVGGAVIQWLRDEMGLIRESREAETYARAVDNTGGVYIVPAFTGLGAPHWDMSARGCIVGITRGTKKEHIIRAAQESIAYQSLEMVEAMQKDACCKLKTLKVDGGASRDAFLMQFQADILGIPVCRPDNTETTALGAALLAGLSTGMWQNTGEIKNLLAGGSVFTPAMQEIQRAALLKGWRKAVSRSLNWADDD
ncbi:MAG: glycerol kinase GlpK [Eubacteriales bacterium]